MKPIQFTGEEILISIAITIALMIIHPAPGVWRWPSLPDVFKRRSRLPKAKVIK